MITKLTSAGRIPLTDEELADYDSNLSAYKASADDRAAEKVRAKRDSLLAKSDWTQVADAPVDKAAWAAYRQALRDITAQESFPNTVDWPVAP